MRIVCISDTHGVHRKLELPPADVLIHAGDFMASGRSIEEIDDFDDWLDSLPHRHKIVVAGNHDLLFESTPVEAKVHLSSAVYLENASVTLEGLHFWGCPVTPVLRDWAFSVDRGACSREFWSRIPAETDVLVTHGPPFGILDKDHILSSHMGCQDLTQAVREIKPRLHVFGHVHGGYGQETWPNGTCFVNCAVLNGGTLNPPIILDIDHGVESTR
jgi:Icc-related predicted phosphoesterase